MANAPSPPAVFLMEVFIALLEKAEQVVAAIGAEVRVHEQPAVFGVVGMGLDERCKMPIDSPMRFWECKRLASFHSRIHRTDDRRMRPGGFRSRGHSGAAPRTCSRRTLTTTVALRLFWA